MKIPLVYPKIPDGRLCPLNKCIVFEKYDGTNLHWVWKRDPGNTMTFTQSGGTWTHFGTRRDQFELTEQGIADFNAAHPGLEEAVPIFNRTYRKLGSYPIPHKYGPEQGNEVTLFTEFLGDKSFAGTHQVDDPKRLILIDVATTYKNLGIVSPGSFYGDYGQFDDHPGNTAGTKIPEYHIASILYSGKYTGQLVEEIRRGKYKVNEGVVCKGMYDGKVYMVKIKTNAYMERLKSEFKDKWKNYWE